MITILYALNLLFWLVVWLGFRKANKSTTARLGQLSGEATNSLSVVVSLKNEAHNAAGLIQSLKAQVHPHFEVLLIDDQSQDETVTILRETIASDPRFCVLTRPTQEPPGKKSGLTYGIAQANHERLVFTDADCRPGPHWLMIHANLHRADPDAVWVGYGPLFPEKTWLNQFSRFETQITALFTGAAIGLGLPYMAVGRNMSYTRTMFHRVNGFVTHQHRLSGDDDLFIQSVRSQKAGKVRYFFTPDSAVFSTASQTWMQWFRQKKRHVSAGVGYPPSVVAILSGFHLTQLATWGMLVALFPAGIALFLLRWGLIGCILKSNNFIQHEKERLSASPALDFLYVITSAVLPFVSVIRPQRRW
ncbi:MAG TPA: glycosyltransferase [Rhodothermales bacterium]|nr:glycosyltransferase [Rhodothermales bacterium]